MSMGLPLDARTVASGGKCGCQKIEMRPAVRLKPIGDFVLTAGRIVCVVVREWVLILHAHVVNPQRVAHRADVGAAVAGVEL